MNLALMMENGWVAIFISFMIGFGLAAMFRPICNNSECLVLHGPPVKDVVDKVYQMGAKCVEFTTEVITCPSEKADVVKTVQFVSAN